MAFQRSSGILLHPTSLPSKFGIGDLGETAYQFIEFLSRSGQKLWQVLPLGPTGYGNSPYMSFSAISGSLYLISPELLAKQYLLKEEDWADIPEFNQDRVDFEAVMPYKRKLLEIAFIRFKQGYVDQDLKNHHDLYLLQEQFKKFCHEEADWLEDYVLFMALHEQNPKILWNNWEPAIARREPQALKQKREELHDQIEFQRFVQFIFFDQWLKLKQYANMRNIQIIGDIPIYVSHNSSDVWANPKNFVLDPETYEVAQMAGVPPDYFSATGQLWGNPVYNWEYLQETHFAWWIDRFRFLNRYVDIIRIDHFRGFEAFWQVPAGEETAINGEWETAPGTELFTKLNEVMGELPILAEDLGVITPEVDKLRDDFGFPGMRVLMFAFGGGSDNFHLPHNYVRNCAVYTGTHDNDTAVGWWQRASRSEKELFYKYIVGFAAGEPINWVLIRMAMAAVSVIAIVPLQDILGLDNSGRMNTPGTATGNWGWRYSDPNLLNQDLSDRLLEITQLYSR
ncbi:4-alpha-glucanotransferase (amylomaltase) [Pseudanabaena sp. lw0831]|uniref:4-alpha-glucanotransferase n=1 Tax=Pseudanabaena sp. lw0831 TaxID=1357935 RepID=UPI001915EC95|nr:4-alpha-glucanotransferase [Pseudanabaena sp. lw0831]GBO52403.1 4-alpha-glucanotransferase (amylomaltase) [Pseudanabaena sp. lw0831]